jgi:dipeptidyl aminopeptidase/acylaminoacyl peptidase
MADSYGAWSSQLTTDVLLAGDLRLGTPAFVAGGLIWSERRPTEGGRTVLVRRDDGGEAEDLTPQDFDVRSRVQEYGGGAWWLVGESIVFSNDRDGRLYRQSLAGSDPVAITPEPSESRSLRYADGCAGMDVTTTFCVRESHQAEGASEPVNEIVEIALDGSRKPRVIATGHDFYASPRLSPDGSELAWLSWDHPNMPWDETELWVAAPDGEGAHIVAGGREESICTPDWSPEGVLHFVSDRSDWWNLYSRGPAGPEPIAPIEAEIGEPAWVFGMQRYAFLGEGRIAVVVAGGGGDWLGVIEPGSATVDRLECDRVPVTASLAAADGRIAYSGGSRTKAGAIVTLDVAAGKEHVLRTAGGEIDGEWISLAREISFDAEGGQSHALYYAPRNPDAEAPGDELPPLLVLSHGGPTARVTDELEFEIQYWTSRGFGVVDVNYGGSTGYGRAYRNRLQGRWGVIDVADCIAAVRHLADAGEVDGTRMAIRGGSAGGYTTLMALTTTDAFAAGASYYGVGDAEALAKDTHKFESRYLDGLIGPYPEAREIYLERSPITHVDGLSCPVILLQGLEDMVVPPAQAEQMIEALERKGIPYAYLAFEGEQHGFRKEATIRRAAEAELAFYGQIFGFEPADEIEPIELHGAAAS